MTTERIYPYAYRGTRLDPASVDRGVYLLDPKDVEPFMHVERDPQAGGRNFGGVKGSALDSWTPGHGLDIGPDEAPDENQWMEALTNSVASIGWKSPANLVPNAAHPRGYYLGEGNHRVGVARRLDVPVPVAIGYEGNYSQGIQDWRDRKNIKALPASVLSGEQFR